jgi:hypothetical protein
LQRYIEDPAEMVLAVEEEAHFAVVGLCTLNQVDP